MMHIGEEYATCPYFKSIYTSHHNHQLLINNALSEHKAYLPLMCKRSLVKLWATASTVITPVSIVNSYRNNGFE